MKKIAFNIAVILVAILLLIIIVPKIFNFLFPPKISMVGTTITIANIQEISQLYITQYYGEVINSLTEENCKENILEIFTLYDQIKSYLDSLGPINYDKNSLKAFKEKFVAEDQKFKDKWNTLIDATLNKNNETRLLKYIYENDKEQFEAAYYDAVISEVRDNSKIKSKDEIAYLARGKVSVSIDLSAAKTDNLTVNSEGTLTVKTPLIIDCIINPQFIYGKTAKGHVVNYPGFVVIDNTKKSTREEVVENVKRVKLGCKLKMIDQALSKVNDEKDPPLAKSCREAEKKLLSFFKLFKTYKYQEGDTEKEVEIKNVKLEITGLTSGSPSLQKWLPEIKKKIW